MRNYYAVFGLGLLVSFSRAEKGQATPDKWTIGNTAQHCLNQTCWYGFTINYAPQQEAKCSFAITKSCVDTVSAVQCNGLDEYSIKASVVSDGHIELQTSYWQVHLHKVNLGTHFTLGDSDAPDNKTKRMAAADDEAPIDDAPTWTLQNVFRGKRIWFGFHITSDGFDPKWCYMLVHVEGDSREASFTDEECVGSNFTASWGYREEEDAGILTLFNSNRTRKAWFGWNNVNNSTDLPDVGPNETMPVNG
ncbi:hypothetical protein CDD81_3630 [Ophiocordyceps australis]|uniref:Uncharacterized protein n=1 Tax=Ophiocordyceps australis TaxID=1399860 RepID=A0A2C5YBJ7_9HYPO|nr:hypothetical protein CDD81_3630 [Ophiocordyceps australis]